LCPRSAVAIALERGIHIVPTLVHGATIPRKEGLPEDIRALVRKNAVEITDKRWDYDIGSLIDTVREALARSPRRLRFLAQVPPWDHKGWQWIADEPSPDDVPPKYD
jgi:hypothetical protein